MADDPTLMRPWRLFRPGIETELRAATLVNARAMAETRWSVGFVRVEHETTGESWVRRAGKWEQDRAGVPGHLPPDPESAA